MRCIKPLTCNVFIKDEGQLPLINVCMALSIAYTSSSFALLRSSACELAKSIASAKYSKSNSLSDSFTLMAAAIESDSYSIKAHDGIISQKVVSNTLIITISLLQAYQSYFIMHIRICIYMLA